MKAILFPSFCNKVLLKGVTKRSLSIWGGLKQLPPDKILGITQLYQNDKSPNRVNLGVGSYKDNDGNPFVLNSVKLAKQAIKADDHEYLPIEGLKSFVTQATKLAYGTDNTYDKYGKHTVAVQCLSGTGGCRVLLELLSLLPNRNPFVYVPNPTWPNHITAIERSKLSVKFYHYLDTATNRQLNIDGMLSDLENIPNNSIVLLHACAHNPTGIDPTPQQWQRISNVMKGKQHIPLFDCAYQGFASGDIDKDAYGIRLFAADFGHRTMLLGQSFAKNFGLYGERVGCASILTDAKEDVDVIMSQLKGNVIRPMYSSPPAYGAKIVAQVLNDKELYQLWKSECKIMADRIIDMRMELRRHLEETYCSTLLWHHISDQIGMFCYSGLQKEHVQKLREQYHVYCTDDGRFSMSGVNTHNVQYLARAIHEVTSTIKPNNK